MDLDSEPEECFLDQLDEPCPDVDISVVEGVPRGHGLSAYVGYVIKLRSPSQLTVERRYSEFSALREVLVRRWPGVIMPCLPAKHASGSNSLRVVNERVKYLSYFLNNCARLPFVFMADEFQLFLTSTDPDLRTRLERLPALPYCLTLNRYEEAFAGVKADETRRGEVALAMRDQVQPFRKLVQGQRIALINLKRQVYRLALRREEYLRTSKILFCDTLPNLEGHLSQTASQAIAVLDCPSAQQAVVQFKQRSSSNYWLLFECIKLQLGQAQSAVEALQSRQTLEREQERLIHDIAVNDQELLDIRAGKKTLKQFFGGSKEKLAAEIDQANLKLRQDVEAIKLLNLIAAEITVGQLVQGYRKRREELWRKAWRRFVGEEEELAKFMEGFYAVFLKA